MIERQVGSLERRGRWLLFEGIGILNLLSFLIVGAVTGGWAPLGKHDGSHFFVGNHGRLIEVSRFFYSYSWVHMLSQIVTVPLLVKSVVRLRKAGEPWSLRGRGAA